MVNPLNNAAGSVPIPEDPREVAAATRASDILWRAFPYFSFRYGERGKRFGHSDAAYFLTLIGYDQSVIDQQINWTAGVLSQRGMPSFLLELQLRTLFRVLSRQQPDSDRYTPLLRSADMIRENRRKLISDNELAALSRDFASAAGMPGHRWALGTGIMLAYAAADEFHGIKNAVTSIEGWLTDPAVFTPAWIAAVRSTLRAARRIASKTIPAQAPRKN
jgi:hypothetical protein